jgi:polysaccharide export outer membrane protein
MGKGLFRAIFFGVLLLAGAPPSAQAGGRVLTPSDVVSIRVVGQPDLDATARVEPDGTINVPYVGRIKAADRTEDEVAHAVQRRLVELRLLADP